MNIKSPLAIRLLAKAAGIFVGSMLGLVSSGTVLAQSYSLTTEWSVATTENTNGLPPAAIGTGNLDRGLAYNAASNHVMYATRGGGATVYAFDADTGLLVTNLNMTGVSGGTLFSINQVAAGEDGVVYGFNLSVGSFKIYLWTNYTDAPHVAFSGDASSGNLASYRAGDAVTIRGSGLNTEILVGTGSTGARTNLFLFRTANGLDFSPTLINVPITANDYFRYGFTFFTNNTILAKVLSQPTLLIQYPSSALTDPVINATVLATNATFPAGFDPHVIHYNPISQQLAGITPTAPARIVLYDYSNPASPALLATNVFPTAVANGNATGAIDFGGEGGTNQIFALWSNNGIVASRVDFASVVVPPSITTQPAGGTIYTNSPRFVLTVGASGSAPLQYQWRFNSNIISGATNSTYVLQTPPFTAEGFYDVLITNAGGATNSNPAFVNIVAPVTSSVVTQLWSIATGTRPYADNNYGARGLAYDVTTGRVLVSSRASTNIFVLNADNGEDLFMMNTLGIGGGTFALNLVGVADDGVVYAGNLALTGNGESFFIYSWPSASADAFPAYAYAGGDPSPGSGARWGDTFAVRGAGADTQILIGSAAQNQVALFTTTDGQSFTPTAISVPDAPPGFAGLGLTFGEGNTFWAKAAGFDLRQISFNLNSGTGTVIQRYTVPSDFPSGITGIGVDPTNSILAGVLINDNPHNLRFYQLSGDTNAPTLFHQAFFPSFNIDAQGNAVVVLKNNRAYALEVNNGIIGLAYGNPPAVLPAFRILSVEAQAGGNAVITFESVASRAYQLQATDSLSTINWQDVGGSIVASGGTTSVTNTVTGTNTRFFRVKGL